MSRNGSHFGSAELVRRQGHNVCEASKHVNECDGVSEREQASHGAVAHLLQQVLNQLVGQEESVVDGLGCSVGVGLHLIGAARDGPLVEHGLYEERWEGVQTRWDREIISSIGSERDLHDIRMCRRSDGKKDGKIIS